MDIKDFQEYMLRNRFKPETVKTYTFQLSPFLETFPDAHKFTFRDMKAALSEYFKSYPNMSYRNTIMSSIKKYYDFLIESGYRDDHPCRTIRFKAMRNKSVIHTDLFSSAELELLMERPERYEKLRVRNQIIASLLIYQGLGSNEIAALEVQHIDLDAGRIYIKESNSGARRHLDMHPRQYKLFDVYIHEIRKESLKIETDRLFIGIRGTPITREDVNYVVEVFRPAFPDRQLNPEIIRQSVIANWLNEKRFPIEQVQLMAGHKWISTTVRYRQAPADEKRLIINRIHPLG